MNAVGTLQDTIAGAAETVGPSVVGLGRGWGHGSGVVIADGQVLTSAHNLRREETTVSFADGRRETGTVAGVDSDLDLAVVSVDTGDAPAVRWDPAGGGTADAGRASASGAAEGEAGASASGAAEGEPGATASEAAAAAATPGIGAPVVALANPGGRGLRATLGFVSSGGRSFRGPRGRRIRGAIEHTAPLPRGSSGGPLVDPDGICSGSTAFG
jgi:serine protease Do